MVKKIKITVILGFVLLFIFILLLNLHSGHLKILGKEFFKLGNKKVFIENVPGTKILSNQDSIKKYLDIRSKVFFLIVDDSTRHPINKVFIDYFLMGDIKDFDQIIALLEQDTTAIIIDKKISSDALMVKQMAKSDFKFGKMFVQTRFNKCFPYFLRVRSVWIGSSETPPKIKQIFNAIEVRE